jgi:KipI family sensor histidine kinase inhibitor
MQTNSVKEQFIGESCLCWSVGDAIGRDVSARILHVYRSLKQLQTDAALGVRDIVPSYNAVAVYFDPVGADIDRIRDCVRGLLAESQSPHEIAGKEVTLPVLYDGQDLDRVAAHNGLSHEEAIRLHAAGRYTVAMIGFLPHFPYLVGLPAELTTPRLDDPRYRVPAGTVAIGGAQTGVYPQESPGGWNIIGTTDPELLIPLEPGDRVVFERL